MRPEEDEGSTKGCEFSNRYTVKSTVLTINDKVFRIIIRNRSFKLAFSVRRMDGEERVFESIRERARVVAHGDPRKQELRSLVDAPFVGLRAYSLPNRISKASWSLEPPTVKQQSYIRATCYILFPRVGYLSLFSLYIVRNSRHDFGGRSTPRSFHRLVPPPGQAAVRLLSTRFLQTILETR